MITDKGKTVPAPQFATALGRQKADDMQVLAQSSGPQAGAMLQLARAHEIPVVQDFALSSALRKLPTGALIPDQVFQTVALLLDFLMLHETILEDQVKEQEQVQRPVG